MRVLYELNRRIQTRQLSPRVLILPALSLPAVCPQIRGPAFSFCWNHVVQSPLTAFEEMSRLCHECFKTVTIHIYLCVAGTITTRLVRTKINLKPIDRRFSSRGIFDNRALGGRYHGLDLTNSLRFSSRKLVTVGRAEQ